MLAVHLEDGAVTIRDIEIPHRPEGFALLRLLLAGICNTDLAQPSHFAPISSRNPR